MSWFNRSTVTLNFTSQILDIYRCPKHLQTPHFSKTSIIDMSTFPIIHTTNKLEITTAKQWNNAILSCSLKSRTSKSHTTLHTISNRIFFSLFKASLTKFSLLRHKMINTFLPEVSMLT